MISKMNGIKAALVLTMLAVIALGLTDRIPMGMLVLLIAAIGGFGMVVAGKARRAENEKLNG